MWKQPYTGPWPKLLPRLHQCVRAGAAARNPCPEQAARPTYFDLLLQKTELSGINCLIIIGLAVPLYPLVGDRYAWQMLAIGMCFGYCLALPQRCIGAWRLGLYQQHRTTIIYAGVYAAQFSVFFYWLVVPNDLLYLDSIAQAICIKLTGNSLSSFVARNRIMTREQYLHECKKRAGALLLDGKPHAAVESLRADLEKWPDLRDLKPQWQIDLGHVLAREGNNANLIAWIDGFK